jgi:enoyl-CoA hydratase/carnithine racemase
MPQLEITRRGRIAILTMNRPEHGNRVSQQMAKAVAAALEQARREPQIGACVITGRGDVFCLGGLAGWRYSRGARSSRVFIDMHHAFARLAR